MAYSKQNFQDGQILTAANLEAMENGIIAGQGAENLLDNSDFRNPVNQRGKTSYTGNGYTIDRWKLSANTLNVGSDGITLVAGDSFSAELTQYISGLRDGVYTQALNVNGTIYTRIIQLSHSTTMTIDASNAAYTGGHVSCAVNSSGYFCFLIHANAGYSITVRWAALYEGSYDANTLPAYVPKDKHVEMLNCNIPLAPHNLLDNSDFRIKNNIINTKGLTDYSFNSGDVFDRWRLHWTGDGRVSIKDGYIELYRKTHCAYLFQHPRDLQSMVGKTYTLAAKARQKGFIGWIDSTQEVNCGLLALNDWDIITFTFTVGSATSDIGEAGIEIATQADSRFEVQWVALYEGVYTKETLPAYVAKGKHVEMLNCGVPLAPHNLLDNSDFTNPVNQRGVTSEIYNQKFIVDKWECSNVSSDAPISVNTNGITLNNAAGTHTQGVEQYISIKDGTYTVAAKTDSSIWIRTFSYSNKNINDISSSFDGKGEIDVGLNYENIFYIAIRAFAGYSIKVEWAALYEGSYTADTLPSYVPKGKHVEMLNCGVPLTPHNLLDNTDFSHPIAQAGLNGMHGSTKYVCDRWISWDADATFGGNYIRPWSPIDQRLSKTVIDINKTYTAAFCYADGKIKLESGTFSNGFGSDALGIYCMKQEDSTDYVTVRLNTGKEIHWAALYEGSYDATTLPAYQPKGYATELAECQRYYVHCGEASWMTGFYKGGEGLVVEIPAANNIRTPYPTIIVNSPKIFTTNGWYDKITYASCKVTNCWTKLLFRVPGEVTKYLTESGVYLIAGIVGISADL